MAVPPELAEAFREAIGMEPRPQRRAAQIRGLEERITRLDHRFEDGFIEREEYRQERRRRMAEVEALRAEPDEPVSLMARRQELRTLVG